MIDVFQEVRERIPAQNAARYYGLTFDRKGWAVCPFHSDKHPSMSFKNGRFRCWACNESGDSIDFTGKLLGLEPVAAVERLNVDFCLGLPLHRKPTPAEMQAVQQRQRDQQTLNGFVRWRDGMTKKLCECFQMAHWTLKEIRAPADLDKLTPAQLLAIQHEAYLEHLADTLISGSAEQQMGVFRQRRGVTALCEKILGHICQRSKAA